MFEKSVAELQELGAEITTREIKQQPELWQEVWETYQQEESRITTFLEEIKAKHGRVRVIFTGAGTSAYVGEVLLPYLKENGDEEAFDFQDVPTTSIVANPKSYFKADKPTLLVSFARSGNSPESLATVALGQQLVTEFYQITITCAKEGKLAIAAKGDGRNLLLLMPERSNDAGFAMTGSFSCMTLTSLLIFDEKNHQRKASSVKKIIEMAQNTLSREAEIAQFINQDYDRVIYLGSGALAGLAREVQLKILELTAGKIATLFDSSLGFRHGPKSFVNEKTLVFLFVSNNPYTRQYDRDMLKEIKGDEIAKSVCGIYVKSQGETLEDGFAFQADCGDVPDGYLALAFALFGQTVSLLSAIKVGNKPDTPSPTGTVNRVVQGVTIYDNL